MCGGKRLCGHPKALLRISNSFKSKSAFPSLETSWKDQVDPIAPAPPWECGVLYSTPLTIAVHGPSHTTKRQERYAPLERGSSS